MELRYVVAKVVPDLIRQEPLNVGVILQSNEWVDCMFIEKIPKDWDISEDFAQDVVRNLNKVWQERLQQEAECIRVAELQDLVKVRYTNPMFLMHLHQEYSRHLQFSEVRMAEVEITDGFGLDIFLRRLYDTFVAPRPRLRKPPARSRLHTKLKDELKQLKLFGGELIQEHYQVMGTLPWVVDFWYRCKNGVEKEVAISVADFSQRIYIDRVKDIYAIGMDLKQIRQDTVERISVVQSVTGLDEHKKAFDLIERASDCVYVFEIQERSLFEHIQYDLAHLPQSERPFTRRQFHNDLKRATRRNT